MDNALSPLLRSVNINTPATYTPIVLAAHFFTMTKSLITGSAPLAAWRDLVRLVLTSGYPLRHFLASPVHGIRLRTIGERRRSYPCYVHPPRRIAKRWSPSLKSSSGGSRQSSRQNSSRSGSRNSSTSTQSGRISKRPRQRRTTIAAIGVTETGAAGLHNPHNFCYRRAVLQCLLHVPSLYDHLAQTHTECFQGPTECVPCALKAFFHAYWNDRTDANFPRGAVKALDRTLRRSYGAGDGDDAYGILRTEQQNDAHEFLTVLLSKLVAQAPETEQELDRLFMLQQHTSWTCDDCGQDRISAEHDQGFTLALAGAPKRGSSICLSDLLDEYCEEDAAVRCDSEQCSGQSQRASQLDGEDNTSKQRHRVRKISRGPEVLSVNLRRSQWVRGQSRKLTDDVDFPEDLDLTRYTTDAKPLRYRLYGVAAHSGESVDSGHWVAAVRSSDGTQYQTINDEELSHLEEPDFDELRHPQDLHDVSYDPALLVYVKIEGK